MLTVEEEQSIFETAPPYLRVAIVLLVQTGGRTYSEGLSLRWDQVDLENQVIHLAGELKTSESAQPLPLTRQACEILREWKNEQRQRSPFLFPSPRDSNKPIGKRTQGLADYTQEGRRLVFPDLQSAPCVLHATELGCSRCSCATRHAS